MGTVHPIVTAVRALEPLVRARAAAAEAAATPDAEVVTALAAAGAFGIGVPESLGGPECDPLTSIAVIDAVARVDGATGWVVMIGAETTGIAAMHLGDETAADVVAAHPGVIICGALNPQGRARRVADGWVVSGRWPFASGSQHAHWFWAQCIVDDDRARPEVIEVLLPRDGYDVELTWNAPGLRGSGSHDVVATDVVVPDGHVTRTRTVAPRRGGALSRVPATSRLAYNKVGVATGITRAAIDHFVDLAGARVPRFSRAPLAERPRAQRAVADAEAALGGASGFVTDAVGDLWATVIAGDEPTVRQQALVRLACSDAVERCARAVTGLYESAGTAMSDAAHPLARCFRDVHVIGQHLMVSPHVIDDAGRVLLGLEPLSPVF
jgi:alkylation response protein AidB-like acyl-CoA dehydrogenase